MTQLDMQEALLGYFATGKYGYDSNLDDTCDWNWQEAYHDLS